jgi:hypothetical protein
MKLLFTVTCLYWISPQILICEIYINYFWRGIELFLVCLAVDENARMPENYGFMMDHEYQEKKKEIYLLK